MIYTSGIIVENFLRPGIGGNLSLTLIPDFGDMLAHVTKSYDASLYPNSILGDLFLSRPTPALSPPSILLRTPATQFMFSN